MRAKFKVKPEGGYIRGFLGKRVKLYFCYFNNFIVKVRVKRVKIVVITGQT